MGRLHGKDFLTITVHSTDMKADTLQLNFGVGQDVIETTTIGDQWKEFTASLKGGNTFDHVLFFDNTATTGSWAAYVARYNAATAANVTLISATGLGTIVTQTLVTNLSLPITVNDMLRITATHQQTGPVTIS